MRKQSVDRFFAPSREGCARRPARPQAPHASSYKLAQDIASSVAVVPSHNLEFSAQDGSVHGGNAQIARSRGYRLEAGGPDALNSRLWDGTTATELAMSRASLQDIRESGWAPVAGASEGIGAKRLKKNAMNR